MAVDRGTGSARSLGVLIISPHRVEGEALRVAVEQDEEMRVVGSAVDAEEAAYMARGGQADVALVGWGWSPQECLEVLALVHAEHDGLPLLVISAVTGVVHIKRAIEAGARGFLPADVDLDDLLHAIRTTPRDEELTLHRTLAPAFLAYLAGRSGAGGPKGLFDSLTPREQEVVRLLARGLADRDLAQTLFISVRTVQTHLSHIYDKLGAHTRTEVALMAVREGWASLPSED